MARRSRVRKRGFGVSLPLTIQPSVAARVWPPDILGWQRAHVVVASIPWRSLTITVVLFFVCYQVALRGPGSWFELAWAPTLLLGFVLCMLEMTGRRDRLTTRGIERRRWLFSARVTLIRYEEIDSIEVEFPYLGWEPEAGDLRLVAGGTGHLFIAIKHPETIASAIEYLVEARRARGR